MWMRLRHVFGEAPFLFFGVVIGVAILFRVGVGWMREASAEPVVAPTFVTTAPEPGLAPSGFVPPERTSTGTSLSAEVGAGARPPGSPSPPRVAPRPRGHGRRAPRP
jgi:hypothetical protein